MSKLTRDQLLGFCVELLSSLLVSMLLALAEPLAGSEDPVERELIFEAMSSRGFCSTVVFVDVGFDTGFTFIKFGFLIAFWLGLTAETRRGCFAI